VTNNIPINFSLFANFNERDALISQLKYLKSGDILVCDRGYFSEKLMDILTKNKINFVFRIKNTSKYSKMLKGDINDKIIDNVRVIKYELKSSAQYTKKYKKHEELTEDYYLLTSLTDKKYAINFFQEVYHKRWTVETNFRFCKYYASLGRIKSKSINFVKQDIQITNFIFILIGHLENLLTKHFKLIKKKINRKLSMKIITSDILHYLIKNKVTKKISDKIFCILKTLLKYLVKIQKDRHYKRETKIPINHWTSMWIFRTRYK
jgi:Transposase DDE domain